MLCSSTDPIFEEIFVPEIWMKMFSANQIAGFFHQPYPQDRSVKQPEFLLVDTNSHNLKVKILQLRAKFQTVMVTCLRFVWITNSNFHFQNRWPPCSILAQIPYLGRFLFHSYGPKCSQPIKLQGFFINHIPRTDQ